MIVVHSFVTIDWNDSSKIYVLNSISSGLKTKRK